METERTSGLQERAGAAPRPAAPSPRLIVGIGASAGGIDACQSLLGSAPSHSDITFIVILHLAPEQESHLAGILAKATTMPVTQATESVRLEPNRVYVIAPATSLRVHDGQLEIGAGAQPHYRARPIDTLLSSLAASHKEAAVGIVLSGTGDDGAAGLQEIRAAGGLCLVQDPEGAEYPGMPQSAVDTGAADAVVAPEKMGEILLEYAASPPVRPPGEERGPPTEGLEAILALLGETYRVDFREYKKGTLERRTDRRMGMKGISGRREYLAYLCEHPEEVTALYHDLLIDVTSFFRDPDEWELLARQIAPPLLASHHEERPLRIWSAGCATGEEAYGLAMIFLEQLERARSDLRLQVFASDLSHDALAFARRGLYPTDIERAVSPERLDRFFRRTGEHFEVERALRDVVTFAAHDLLSDPPFAHLDLVSCRNVLIYLEPPAQQRLLESFHFSLRRQGVLFLGNAETTGSMGDLFEAVASNHRFYRATGTGRAGALRGAGKRAPSTDPPLERAGPGGGPGLARRLEQLVLEAHANACVVVNRRLEILYLFGPTEKYLTQPRGEARMDLLAWVRTGLYTKLRTGLAEAVEHKRRVTVSGMRGDRGGAGDQVEADIEPITTIAGADGLFLVVFRDVAATQPVVVVGEGGADEPSLVRHLEQELHESRQEVKAAVDRLKTANEEYHASHEELLSLNEEFQSSNEELETSKEELQSLNEELTTINRQLQDRNAELRAVSADLSNLLMSTNVPTVFLDVQLRIRRITPACAQVMRVTPGDVGRPLEDIKMIVQDQALLADAARVLEDLAPVETEVPADDGRWFLRRAHPYCLEDGRIDGVCLTFQDITVQKDATAESEDARQYAEGIIRTSRTPLLVLDTALRVVSANEAFYETFQVSREQSQGQRIYELGDHQWDIPELRKLLEEVLPREQNVQNYDIDRTFEKVGWRSMRLNADVMRRAHRPGLILVSIEDVTDLRRAEAAAQRRAEELLRDHRRKDEFLAMLGHELRNPLSALTTGLDLVKLMSGVPEPVERVHGMMGRQTRRMAAMLDQLLDVARVISGKLELTREAVDIADAAAAAIEAARPAIDAARHELRVSMPPEGSALVLGDALRLAQILENLLVNAAKYTDPGGQIWLAVEASTDTVEISVRDTGIGMEPEILEQIFDVFAQAPSHLDRAKGGLGLGLSLVRSLVEMHGGTVEAHSTGAGRGSELTVTLPRLQAGRLVYPRNGTPRARLSGAPRKILVVDDEKDASGTLASLLGLQGHQVRTVDDGPAAIEAARSFRPEIVLLDLGLPEMDGYEVARRLRQEHGPRVLIVALTGYRKDDDRLEQAGFDTHLLKPPDLELLSAMLAAYEPGGDRQSG